MLGEMFQNYRQIDRFDAATGLAFETRGPFGAVVASAVSPGLERVPVKGPVHPGQARYRLFIIFRGTVPAVGDLYTDDLSTDAKTAAPKLPSSVGNRVGEVARGFLNTYVSCRSEVVERLLPRGLAFLRKQHRQFAESVAKASGPKPAGRVGAGRASTSLPTRWSCTSSDIAWAGPWRTCRLRHRLPLPRLQPGAGHLRQPACGQHRLRPRLQQGDGRANEYHPRTRYLRSIRVVARSVGGRLDPISALPGSCRTTSTSIRAS